MCDETSSGVSGAPHCEGVASVSGCEREVDVSKGAAAERLLVVVAHPDDETFGTGSLLAMASRTGADVIVACATRGEAGEPTHGSVPPGTSLAEVREAELRAAAGLLGVDDVVVWNWRDSGMDGAPIPGTLCAAPMDEVTASIVDLIEDRRPTTVVTLDASDGHRDHAKIRDATLAAVRDAGWSPGRVYLHCLPSRLMRRWVEELQRRNPDAAHLGLGDLGTPDDQITTLLDSSDVLDLRERAVAAHASQRSPYDVMPPELRREFLTNEALRRVHPPWPDGAALERRLF